MKSDMKKKTREWSSCDNTRQIRLSSHTQKNRPSFTLTIRLALFSSSSFLCKLESVLHTRQIKN